jgi:hypothetical protein
LANVENVVVEVLHVFGLDDRLEGYHMVIL